MCVKRVVEETKKTKKQRSNGSLPISLYISHGQIKKRLDSGRPRHMDPLKLTTNAGNGLPRLLQPYESGEDALHANSMDPSIFRDSSVYATRRCRQHNRS